MTALIATLYTYVTTHPDQVAYITLTVLTALTAFFKPKTPDEYAAMNPRVAAMWKLLAAVLPDVVKAVKVLPQVAAGKTDPAKDPAES